MVAGPGEREYQLMEQFNVTLDALGAGWIRGVGPRQQRERWEITSMQTTVETPAGSAEARLYVYQDSTDRLIQGSYSGNLDTSDSTVMLQAGQKLNFRYEMGEPTKIARITIDGRRYVRGA